MSFKFGLGMVAIFRVYGSFGVIEKFQGSETVSWHVDCQAMIIKISLGYAYAASSWK